MKTRMMLVTAVGMALLAPPVLAQSDVQPRAAVTFAGGVGSGASTTGVALGGSILVDLNQVLSLEGDGTYLDRGAGADAVGIKGSVLFNLVPARRRLVPYAAFGGGVYRASFDLADPRLLGAVGTQFAAGTVVCPAPGTGIGPGPGAGFGPGDGTCTASSGGYWGVGQMSNFYAQRLGAMVVPATGGWQRRSFVDPLLAVGGGVRFNVNERFLVRPDLRAFTVFGNGDTYTMAVFGISVGYRF